MIDAKDELAHNIDLLGEEEILRRLDSHAALVEACRAQHDAIDILFAMLIERSSNFFPSKSGKPWEAMLQGSAALAAAGETGGETPATTA